MDDFFITPSERADFVELSRTPTGTKLFKKHILSTGTLNYNGKQIPITDETLDSLKKNFDAKVCDIVQVPVADKDNQHTEDPLRNAGEVIDLERDGNKLYAIIDARKYADDFGKTLIGASAFFSMDYKDTRIDKKVGPTLLHVAVTNRPHEVELEDYQELIAASADGNSEAVHLTALTEKETNMTKDELISALKIEHGIDVTDLQTRAAAGDKAVALSNGINDALSGLKDKGIIALSNSDELTGDEIVGAFAQIAEQNVALTGRIDSIEKDGKQKAAESAVDKAIADGFIFPAKRQANIDLYLSNSAAFEALLPEKPLVALSAEALTGSEDSEALSQVDAEVVRLSQTDAAKQYIG